VLAHQVQTDRNSGIVVVVEEEDTLACPALLVMVEQVQPPTPQLVGGLVADQADLMEQEQEEMELVDQLIQVVAVVELCRLVPLIQGMAARAVQV
tara:strand:+ start:493 stop:777 length:285 start_codon:yes stop_codon:yes gene_type:complete